MLFPCTSFVVGVLRVRVYIFCLLFGVSPKLRDYSQPSVKHSQGNSIKTTYAPAIDLTELMPSTHL